VQRVLHYSPLRIGFAFLPVSVLMGLISVRYADRLVARFGGRRLCVAGLSLISLGLALFAFAPVTGGYWLHLFPSLTALGIGAGLAFPPLMGLAMSGVQPQDAGLASGLINTTGQVGGALGLAVFATLTSGRTNHLLAAGQSMPAALTGGYHLGFWIAAVLVLGGAGIALFAMTKPAQSAEFVPAEPDGLSEPDALADAVV